MVGFDMASLTTTYVVTTSTLYWYCELNTNTRVNNVHISPKSHTVYFHFRFRWGTICTASEVKTMSCVMSDDQSILPHARLGYLQNTHPMSSVTGILNSSKQLGVESGMMVSNCAVENAGIRMICVINPLAMMIGFCENAIQHRMTKTTHE